jgi:hypothetical protein
MSNRTKVSHLEVFPVRREQSTTNDYWVRVDQVCLAAIFQGLVKSDSLSRRRLLEAVYASPPDSTQILLSEDMADKVTEVDYYALYELLMPCEESEEEK